MYKPGGLEDGAFAAIRAFCQSWQAPTIAHKSDLTVIAVYETAGCYLRGGLFYLCHTGFRQLRSSIEFALNARKARCSIGKNS